MTESRSPAEGSEAVDSARTALALAKRDIAGFIEGDQPNVTEEQFKWLSYRMSHDSDNAALAQMEADEEDFDVLGFATNVLLWRSNPQFSAIESIALGNKREGTRLLLVHQAGKVLRAMSALLDSRDPKIQLRAVTLWSRQMGLLIDKLTLVDKDDLARLAERMMKPMQVTVVDGPSIVEGEFTDLPSTPSQNRVDLD